MLNTTSEAGKVNSELPGTRHFTSESSWAFKEHLILILNNLFQSIKSDGKKPQMLISTEQGGKRIILYDLAGLRNIRIS